MNPGHFIPQQSGTGVESSPIFAPSWRFQEGNIGHDLQSCRDFIDHVTPPAILKRMDAINPRQSINRGYKAAFDSLMWSANLLKKADYLDKFCWKLGAALKGEKAKVKDLEGALVKEKEELGKFKEEHAANIGRVDSVLTENESLKAQLTEQVRRSGEMEAALQQAGLERNAAAARVDDLKAQVGELKAALKKATEEKDQANFIIQEACEEKQKLQAGLPDIILKALRCPGITAPFMKVVMGARALGQHEVAAAVAPLLNPLPEPIARRINPQAPANSEAAADALKNLSTSPYMAKLTEDPDMPAEAILAIDP